MLSQKREYERLLSEQESSQKVLAGKEGVLFALSQKYATFEEKLNVILSSLEKEKIE